MSRLCSFNNEILVRDRLFVIRSGKYPKIEYEMLNRAGEKDIL